MEVDHPSGDSDQKGVVMGDLLKEIQIMSPEASDALKRAVMGDLLKEIQIMFPEAADVLKQARLVTDSDIQSLTREDLNELLPGVEAFRLRKNVFETIKKSRPPNMPQKNWESCKKKLPGVSICSISNTFTFGLQSQMKSREILPNDNVDPMKNNHTRQQNSKAEKGAVMGDLLKEIQIMSPEAADVLKQAGFETDSDIRSLTRQDLHELLPGRKDLRLRKDVFNKIHIPRPPKKLLKELGELQNNLASSAQIDPGIFIDHIRFINEQLVNVQLLLDDNVNLLKTIKTRQLDSKADEGSLPTREDHPQGEQEELQKLEAPQMSPSPAMDSSPQLEGSQDAPGSDGICNSSRDTNAGMSPHYYKEVTVKYTMVVAGETFGAHTQLMDQVKRATKGDVRLLENSQDSQIIIVFCPITSRVESDVKAAMSGVPGDKPIILVKMHHVCESKSSLCFNTLIEDRNDVVQVNVFYHENFPGLLNCTLNETAVDEIQRELLKHSNHRSKDTSPSTTGQVPENQAKKAKKNT